MNEAELKKMLGRLEASLGWEPALSEDLADRVRRRMKRQRVRRRVLTAVGLVILLSLGWLNMQKAWKKDEGAEQIRIAGQGGRGEKVGTLKERVEEVSERQARGELDTSGLPGIVEEAEGKNLKRLQRKLAALRRERKAYQAGITKFEAKEERPGKVENRPRGIQDRLLGHTEQLIAIDMQRETAAWTLLCTADEKREKLALTASATADYQRIIERFPQTRSAELARQRLTMN